LLAATIGFWDRDFCVQTMVFGIVRTMEKTVFLFLKQFAFDSSKLLAIAQPLFAIDRNVQYLFSGGFLVGDFLRAQMGKQIVH
jgi:hypothetical protein